MTHHSAAPPIVPHAMPIDHADLSCFAPVEDRQKIEGTAEIILLEINGRISRPREIVHRANQSATEG